MYRLAYGFVRSPADADDVAQETFVRAYQALGRFRVGEPLYPWLARIASNTALSQLRRRRRKPETPLEPLLEAGQQWGTDDDPLDRVGRSIRPCWCCEWWRIFRTRRSRKRCRCRRVP